MRRCMLALPLACLAILWLGPRGAAGADVVTQPQMQSAWSSLVATNWHEGSTDGAIHINDPLVFNQFNPSLGTLSAVEITMTATIRNDYFLSFVQTPIITTMYVATSATSNPSILSNPTERAMLTDGPTVTLYGPNGTTQIFGPPGTRQPVDFVTLTETSGMWSSLLPTTDPHFIPPSMTESQYSQSLTAANAPGLFSDFIGTGMVGLPVTATAFSSFYSSSGNGGGGVLTTANASVSIQYLYAPAIPEPSSVILLGLGIGVTLITCGLRRRGRDRSRCA